MQVKFTAQERIDFVQWMFARVVPRYDFMNHFLSLGQDIRWRKSTARLAKVFDTGRILDLAAGTADLTMAIKERLPQAEIVGADFSLPMLRRGYEKVKARPDGREFNMVAGDALHLPFADNSFDTLSIAFGIRNIPYHDQALKEMHRVLTPGGRLIVLETVFPRWSFVRLLYQDYLNRLIPKLGGVFTDIPEAYKYMADSIMDFPAPEAFCQTMAEAGFVNTRHHQFTFGIAVVHYGDRNGA